MGRIGTDGVDAAVSTHSARIGGRKPDQTDSRDRRAGAADASLDGRGGVPLPESQECCWRRHRMGATSVPTESCQSSLHGLDDDGVVISAGMTAIRRDARHDTRVLRALGVRNDDVVDSRIDKATMADPRTTATSRYDDGIVTSSGKPFQRNEKGRSPKATGPSGAWSQMTVTACGGSVQASGPGRWRAGRPAQSAGRASCPTRARRCRASHRWAGA